MHSTSEQLTDRAISAMLAGIEVYNKPQFPHRNEAFTILAVNAWELLLKARWLSLHQDDEHSLFVYQRRRTSSGTVANELKTTRSGAPFTHSLSYLAKKLVERKDLNSDAWHNLEIILEFRDSATHFHNESPIFKNRLYEIGAACVRNFAIAAREWFSRELSEFDLHLMPLSFMNLPSHADSIALSIAEANFLSFVEEINHSEFEPEETDYAILMSVAFRFIKSDSQDAIPVRNTSDQAALSVRLTEDQVRDRYPWDYAELTRRCRERYRDFKMDTRYHKIRKEIASDSRFGFVRELDPGNPKSATKPLFNTNILQEFDKYYERHTPDSTSS